MAIRLLPFRDYDEHDVVNLFRSNATLDQCIQLHEPAKRSTPEGDAGVFVKVHNGTLNTHESDWDPIDVENNPTSLLGKTDYPHVARNTYPQAALSYEPVTASGDACIGVTLRQTVARDELGENLLYNPVKKDELYGVLPGEAVPVASKGMFTFTDTAIVGTINVGDSLVPHSEGRASGVNSAVVNSECNKIGTVLAKGHREDIKNWHGGTNVFGTSGLMESGSYYVVKLNCA